MFAFFRSTRQKWIPVQYMLVDFWSAERVASLPTPVQGGSLAPHPLMSIQKQSCPGLLMPWMGSMVFTMVGATIGFTGWPLVTMVGYFGWSTWSRSPSRCEADISKLLWCRCHFSSRTYVGKVHVLSLAHTQNAFKASRKGKKENHIRRRLKSFYMLDLKRLYALEILAVSLMKVAIMDCDAL